MYTEAIPNASEKRVLGILRDVTKADWHVVHYEGQTRCYATVNEYTNADQISADMRDCLKCDQHKSLIAFTDPDHPNHVILPTSYITDRNLGMLRDSGDTLARLFLPPGSPPPQRTFP